MPIAHSLIGREDILTRLGQRLEALKQGYRQNVALVGARFIGKTLLVREFLSRATRDSDLLPIYILLKEEDFDAFLGRWLGSLLEGFLSSRGLAVPEDFQSLVRLSREFIPRTLERMREVKKHAFQKKTTTAFRELLGLTALLGEETGKKVVLLIDEFPLIGELEIADPFGLFGKEMMIQKDTLYLVTSSQPHRTREIFSHRLSLLFGNFEVIEMGALPFASIRRWIDARYPEKTIPGPEFRLLSHLFGNRPHYFDLFMEETDRLWLRKNQAAWSREFLLEGLAETLFSDRGLLNLHFKSELESLIRLGRLARMAVKVLTAIAQGRSKLLPIAAYVGRKSPEIHKVLQRLVTEGVLGKKGSFYSLSDPLFRLWLRLVHQSKERELLPGQEKTRLQFEERLRDEVRRIEEEDQRDLTARLESLFREFRNDVVEISQKKIRCPAFLELASRPTNGRYFPMQGRTSQGRWLCQVYRDPVTEQDVAGFVDELKRFRRGIQRRVMVALGGIELNARLMAQEGRIQVWDLDSLNDLMDLYGKPKVLL